MCIYFCLQRFGLSLGHWITRVWEQCLPSGEGNQSGKGGTYLPPCLPFYVLEFYIKYMCFVFKRIKSQLSNLTQAGTGTERWDKARVGDAGRHQGQGDFQVHGR